MVDYESVDFAEHASKVDRKLAQDFGVVNWRFSPSDAGNAIGHRSRFQGVLTMLTDDARDEFAWRLRKL